MRHGSALRKLSNPRARVGSVSISSLPFSLLARVHAEAQLAHAHAEHSCARAQHAHLLARVVLPTELRTSKLAALADGPRSHHEPP
jgi:hypothetical protein